MDLGIIAKLKGFARKCYGSWATRYVILFLGKGQKPEDIKLPLDKQSMVTNIVMWLCKARAHFNSSAAQLQGVRDCWTKTRLPEAMTASVRDEAVRRIGELFRNTTPQEGFVEPGEEPEATDCGAPVDDPGDVDVRTRGWVPCAEGQEERHLRRCG